MHYKERRKSEENEAVGKLFKDPRYFYKYAKKFSKTNGQLNGFLDENSTIQTDPNKMAEMLKKQYESVASKPKEDFKVEDAEYFFFFTSPDPFSQPLPPARPPAPPMAECQQCQQELPHFCEEDKEQEQDQYCHEEATPAEWRRLIDHHILRIEDTLT